EDAVRIGGARVLPGEPVDAGQVPAAAVAECKLERLAQAGGPAGPALVEGVAEGGIRGDAELGQLQGSCSIPGLDHDFADEADLGLYPGNIGGIRVQGAVVEVAAGACHLVETAQKGPGRDPGL